MPYTLSRLAPGSYDVLLVGVIIASLVRSGETNRATWTAELLMDVQAEDPLPSQRSSKRWQLGGGPKGLGGAELQDRETEG